MDTLSNKLKEVNRDAVGNPVGYKAIPIIYGAVAQLGERWTNANNMFSIKMIYNIKEKENL